ncbi:ATP-grasp domain-containing protein [Sabulilitoribacter arenilitoris]|uniref:ATP-grasp domain-containing protein n=1 Tax=Wocania arenilitoris TaxID=2044858 RepID=A0AAE3EQE1_9FLAO|nr:ATP-grasp domain-containing protein [Wocania arenilitoris]MCF7569082.1 ATP-grasp domain-containing protein [Wocania arenilitoris]
MNNILITSGGRRVSLVKAFMKELKVFFPSAKVFVADFNPKLSPASQIADECIEVCKVTDKNYSDCLLKACVDNNIKIVIPTIDTELLILSQNKKKFLKHNITIVISDENLVKVCVDKINTHTLFKKLDVKVAKEYSKDNYKLPIYIKPINGSGSKSNFIIKKKSQISKYLLKKKSLKFFEYFDLKLYDEYTCDLYYDVTNNLKCAIPRKRIEIRAGEVSKGVTKRNVLKTFIDNKFSFLEGAIGCITVQFFLHKETNDIIGIEINPRFGGGFPLSYLAGGNYPKWIIQEYILNEKLNYFDNWENNLLMLRYDDEILIKNHEE